MPYLGWAPAVFQGVGCFVTPGLCVLCIIITMYDMLRNLCCAAPTLFQLRFQACGSARITCQPSVIIIRSLPTHPPPPPLFPRSSHWCLCFSSIFLCPPPLFAALFFTRFSCSSLSSFFTSAAPGYLHPLWFLHDGPLFSASLVRW